MARKVSGHPGTGEIPSPLPLSRAGRNLSTAAHGFLEAHRNLV